MHEPQAVLATSKASLPNNSSPDTTEAIIQHLITADPGLPLDNPTQSYWQHVEHPLANTQSQSLPEFSDVVVVGSGITGTSVTMYLLEGNSDTKVTLVEARTLCSGATGRNGGHSVTYGGAAYSKLKSSLGSKMAMKVVKFERDTCDQVLEMARHYALEESQVRALSRVRAYADQESLDEAKHSIEEFERDYPDEKGRYGFIDNETLTEVILSELLIHTNKFRSTVFMELWARSLFQQLQFGRIDL
jgi:FAD dependent oxidoreductase